MRHWLYCISCLSVLTGVLCFSTTVNAQTDLLKPVKPPRGAIVLFDGASTSGWVQRGSGKPCEWTLANGELEVKPGTGDILTTREFGDFKLHVEFNVPLMPDAKGQARGNSGVYLHGRYEVQILDSYGLTPKNDDCGAIYGQTPPLVNACRPPEHWQRYDITFHAPSFDAAGNVVKKPRVTVYQNGVKIQDNVEIQSSPTRAGIEGPMVKTGPILLQDHGCKVKFRNIWIVPRKL